MGIDPERLWFEFCRHGIQYYAAGRWSELMGLLPVYGNQHHHAVEMFLKAALTRQGVSLEELEKMGHNLSRLWAAFKKFARDSSLSQYDALIAELDKFEDIRYPDAILKTGMTGGTSIVQGDRAEMWSDQPLPPHYEVNLGEIDGLVAKIVDVIGVNREVLVNKLVKKGAKDVLLEHNPHAAFWRQITDSGKPPNSGLRHLSGDWQQQPVTVRLKPRLILDAVAAVHLREGLAGPPAVHEQVFVAESEDRIR